MSPSLPLKSFLRTSEVADLLGVNPSTVFLWVKKGKLRPQKSPGRNLRFRREDIEQLLPKDEVVRQEPTAAERRVEPRFALKSPALVKLKGRPTGHTYNALIMDISAHGVGLVVFDNNGLFEKLESESLRRMTILNAPGGPLKEVVDGQIKHYETVGDRQVAVGVSLD